MKNFFCALVLACLGVQAHAAPSERDLFKLRRQYLEIKDDSDLYVGQSAAKLKDQGDWDKAEQAATARARASLAEAIEVRIQSKVTDSMQGNARGVTEKTESLTQTDSDLKLANVKTRVLRDFPEEGTLTVLAYLSKKDYRRQLAGMAGVLRVREGGLGIKGGLFQPDWLLNLRAATQKGDLAPQLSGASSSRPALDGESAISMGLDVFWRSIILGFDWTNYAWVGQKYNASAAVPGYRWDKFNVDVVDLSLGYDYVPWNWTIQPYLPLRLDAALMAYQIQTSPLFGASAGIGIRFWPNDSVALDVSGSYHAGFNSVQLKENDGKTPLYMRPGKDVNADLTGTRGQIGISFTGF